MGARGADAAWPARRGRPVIVRLRRGRRRRRTGPRAQGPSRPAGGRNPGSRRATRDRRRRPAGTTDRRTAARTRPPRAAPAPRPRQDVVTRRLPGPASAKSAVSKAGSPRWVALAPPCWAACSDRPSWPASARRPPPGCRATAGWHRPPVAVEGVGVHVAEDHEAGALGQAAKAAGIVVDVAARAGRHVVRIAPPRPAWAQSRRSRLLVSDVRSGSVDGHREAMTAAARWIAAA